MAVEVAGEGGLSEPQFLLDLFLAGAKVSKIIISVEVPTEGCSAAPLSATDEAVTRIKVADYRTTFENEGHPDVHHRDMKENLQEVGGDAPPVKKQKPNRVMLSSSGSSAPQPISSLRRGRHCPIFLLNVTTSIAHRPSAHHRRHRQWVNMILDI